MFFIISKILDFLFTPVVWVFALLLLTVLSRNPVKRRIFAIAALITFFFFTNDFIVDEVARNWEIPATKDSALINKKYDVGIVLGGMLVYDPLLKRVQFDHGSDRLFQALRLYKQGKIKRILLDGGSGSILENKIREAVEARKYLLDIGIPDSAIGIEPNSRNTRENALFVKPILDSIAPHGNYLLITSASHMRRSLRCFEKVGIVVTPYSTDRMAGPRKFIFDHVFIPDKRALFVWDIFLHEWIGYVTYKIAGYI
jgi:uncharacterized SAM-binding protein YcdF (DUF218 family)